MHDPGLSNAMASVRYFTRFFDKEATMKACCNWCLAIVNAPDDYERLTTRCFCSKNCQEKDWLFRKWQNETWLNIIARRWKDETKE